MFKRLQLKFLAICVLIIGVIMAAVLSVVFVSNKMGAERNADRTMAKAMEEFSAGRQPEACKNCLLMYLSEGVYYTNTANPELFSSETVDKITAKIEAGARCFKEAGRTFLVKTGEIQAPDSNNYCVAYTVYDFSVETQQSLRLGVTLIITYFGGMIVIAVISWFIVGLAIRPVRDTFTKQRHLIADASHELKTPLTIISTNLSLIERDSLKVKDKERLNAIEAQTERMNNLVIEMLQLSKLDNSKTLNKEEEASLSDIIVATLLSFDAKSLEKNIHIVNAVEEGIVTTIDRFNFEKLINILLDNALKYCNRGGVVTAGLAVRKKNVYLFVENTGEGILPEDIKYIFDRFYKSDQSREEQRNSFGLGLSIAKTIVQNLKGEISCKSEAGKYARFEVTLPYKPPAKTDVRYHA